jgi:hypothetical protein
MNSDMTMSTEHFDNLFSEWANLAAHEWGYPEPSDDFYSKFNRRIPEGIRSTLSRGLANGIIIPKGHKFTLAGLTEGKRYSWFSKFTSAKEPAPNWEYFVHVALYTKLFSYAEKNNLKLTFEDNLMDLALYNNKELVVCIEVKEAPSQIEKLLSQIRKYQDDVDYTVPDRGNDALRKAKYIISRKPEYFCLYSLGARLDFKIAYPDIKSFILEKDIVPWMP